MNFFFVPVSPEQELEDIRVVLRLPAGRRLIRRLLSRSNILGPSLALPERTEYNEGLRAVGLHLAAIIETAAPGDLARLLQESSNDRQAENAKPRRNEDGG